MVERGSPRVGFLGLMLELYDTALPKLRPTQAKFAEELVAQMRRYSEVVFPGICNTRGQVDGGIAEFEAKAVDLVVVVHLTYAPSLISLPGLLSTTLPVLLLNTQRLYEFSQESPQSAMTENHGMHGVQDLANVLVRRGRGFELLTGHYEDPKVQAELRDWIEAAYTAREIHRARVGVLGYPFEGMGDLSLDTTALLAQVGTMVVQIPIAMVAQEATNAPLARVKALMQEDRKAFQVEKELTNEDHERASRLEWGLRKVCEDLALDGFSMHFGAVAEDGRLESVPFLAASKMLADGFGYGGEGDATSAVAVLMMQLLCGRASFTEMFTMDFANNAVVMSHMGESNWRMARKDQPIRLIRKPFPFGDCHPPASLCFALEPGPSTLVNLVTGAEGRLKLIASEANVLDFPAIETFDAPHYKLAPSKGLAEFLDDYSRQGGSHHLAIAFGAVADRVEKVARMLGLECVLI